MQLSLKWWMLGALVTMASACKSDPPVPQAKTDKAKAAASASASASAATPPPPAYGLDDVPQDILDCSEWWLKNSLEVSARCKQVLELWSEGGVEAAVAKYKAACDGGDGKSCMLLIGALGHPKSPMQSKNIAMFAEDAAALIIKACEKGQHHACLNLTDRMSCGDPDPTYPLSSLTCPSRMVQYMKGKTHADLAALLEPGCNKGHAKSCTAAGKHLKEAKGQVDEVTEHYKKACKLGDPNGCHEAAQVARTFGQQDEERAMMASKFAIEERNCRQLGECGDIVANYKYGWHLPEHLPKIREMLSTYCEKKKPDERECFQLAKMQIEGHGGPVDIAAAIPRLDAICNTPFGNDDDHFVIEPIAQSCRALARLYREGTGVEKNEVKAKALLKQVCVQRDPPGSEIPAACRELKEMGK